jgi:DNA polymerase
MVLPVDQKIPNLTKNQINQLIINLDTCPLKNSGVRVVYPIGNGSSAVMLIGEAPGAKENQVGEPFVGASGKFLNNHLLPTLKLTRENIYLTNIVKCRPPENRDPSKEEKEAWGKILLAEIAFIKPKVIACLGRHSMNFFLPEAKIGQVHGKLQKLQIFTDFETFILPLYHPAAALYNPNLRETLITDFQIIKKFKT